MPKGGVLHFRYSKRLVHDEIIEDSKCNRLIGQKVLISFLDISDKSQSPEILPCRTGTITKSGTIGEFFAIEFSVEDFPTSSNLEEFRTEVSGSLRSDNSVVNLPDWKSENTGNGISGHWAFRSTGKLNSLTTSYDTNSFCQVCKHLSQKEPFRQAHMQPDTGQDSTHEFVVGPFYHALIFKGNVSQFEISDIESAIGHLQLDKSRTALQITGGNSYTLAIFHYHPDLGVEKEFKARHIHVTLRHITNSAEEVFDDILASEYDFRQFRFEASNFAKRLDGYIHVHFQDSDAFGGKKYNDISIPVSVMPSWIGTAIDAISSALPASIPAVVAFVMAIISLDQESTFRRSLYSLPSYKFYMLCVAFAALIVIAPAIIKLWLIKMQYFFRRN